jgi:hypothetical protein
MENSVVKSSMQIRFRTEKGKIFDLELQPEDTIEDAKVRLQEEECVDCSNSMFLFGTSILRDETKIGSLAVAPPQSYIIIHTAVKPKISAHQENYVKKAAKVSDCSETARNERNYSSPSLQYEDPPYFNELIEKIIDIGFSENQAIQALRSARYNVDRAADMLLTGHKFDEATEPDIGEIPKPNFDDLPKPDFGSFKEEEEDVSLVAVSVPPAKYGELQGNFDALTADEKAALYRLEKITSDPSMILQIYIACDKNEDSARECIMSMS